ncbi:hypothetical protein [Bilophila sp.]|uniref:hypothetical protein n=1 Tax=Bilophila sp. TaxID=1929485 RepID=UPI0030769A2D
MPRTARGQGLRVPAAGSAVRLIPGSPGPASRRFPISLPGLPATSSEERLFLFENESITVKRPVFPAEKREPCRDCPQESFL